jgi:hypothetical protein
MAADRPPAGHHEQAKTRINNARAKDLAIEFAGLVRTILSELGGVDAAGGAERILRFLALRFPISARLVSDNARLWKVFDDAETAAAELIRSLNAQDQVPLVPHFETLRRRDRYGEHTGFLHEWWRDRGARRAAACREALPERRAARRARSPPGDRAPPGRRRRLYDARRRRGGEPAIR